MKEKKVYIKLNCSRAKMLMDFVDGVKVLDNRCSSVTEVGACLSWFAIKNLRVVVVGGHFWVQKEQFG